MKSLRNFTIRLSQPVYNKQDDHADDDLFQRKWLTITQFLTGILSRIHSEHRLTHINHVVTLVTELHYRGFSARLDEAFKILVYRELNKQLASIAQLPRTEQITSIIEYFKWIDGAANLLGEVMAEWQVQYLGKKGSSIRKVLMAVLYHEIINHGSIQQLLIESILKEIEGYRQDQNDLSRCRILIKVTKEIGMFSKTVFPQIYDKTCHYYIAKKERLPSNISFLWAVKKQLQKQQNLTQLIGSQELVYVVQKQFISEFVEEMVNFVDYLINEDLKADLDILWSFFKKLNLLEVLEKRVEQLIEDTQKFIKDGDLQKLIRYKLKLQRLLLEGQDRRQMMQLIHNRFQNIVSRNFTICNEMMVDYVMKTLKSEMDVECDELLLEIVRSNPNLDFFFLLYKERLSKEILTNEVKITKHLQLLDQIRQHCGGSLITPIEKMIDDVWRQGKEVLYQNGIFKCRLLYFMNWPDFKFPALGIPQPMRLLREAFQDQYFAKYPRKELNWCYKFGSCRVEINEIQHILTQVQTSIVFYISKAIRPMRLDHLVEVLKINRSEVSQSVDILLAEGIILQNGPSKFLQLNDSNTKPYQFKPQKFKMNSNVVSMVIDRDIPIEACITRMMKKNKKVAKLRLIDEVQQMVRIFKPTIEQINNCIKKLIGKEYLKIVGNDVYYLP